jgi:hypothetical protein
VAILTPSCIEFIVIEPSEASQLPYLSCHLVVIGADCTGSCKSSYHAITPRRPPSPFYAVWFICTLQNIYISNGSFLIYVEFFFFLVSPTRLNYTGIDHHDVTDILLKVAFNTIARTLTQIGFD